MKKELKLDDDKVHVNIFQSNKSLVIEIITDDQESLDLTHFTMFQLFKSWGLKESKDE